MGSVTHQYSAEEIIEMYQEKANDYRLVADELEQLMTTEYIKRIKINIFLELHFKFCKDAINVLEEAVKKIKTDKVDEHICLRLESLFDNCSEEHRNLEDTYGRVCYEDSSDFADYELVHCKLREECDGMGYFDETIKFVRAMISNKSNSIVFNGPVSGTQIQQDTDNSSQKQEIEKQQEVVTTKDNDVEKENVTIKDIFKEKVFEFIIIIIFVIVCKGIDWLRGVELFSSMNTSIQLLFMFLPVICWIGMTVYGIALLCDLVNIIRIRKKGSFVEFVSKKEIFGMILNFFRNEEETNEIRCVGKTYKNIGGNIYLIKKKMCPYCQTEPTGEMHLFKNVKSGQYQWVCSEQWLHQDDFDYKKEF